MSADVQQVAWRNPSAQLRQVVAGVNLASVAPLAASQGGAQSQGWLVINDTAATFVVDVWAGGGSGRPGTGAMRVPVGAASWVQIPVCQGAIGIDPASVQGGGAGSVYLYELYGPVEWGAGLLRHVDTEWWLDVDLPPQSMTWVAPWGGIVHYIDLAPGLANMGHIRVGRQFNGTITIAVAQPNNYYEIGPGCTGTITDDSGSNGGRTYLRIGRAFDGTIQIQSPANRIVLGDDCGTSITLGPSGGTASDQLADIRIGNGDGSTITLTGYQPTVRVGDNGAVTIEEQAQSGYSGQLSYQCAAYVGDGSSAEVIFVARTSGGNAYQARIKCDDQSSAPVYIATGYYHVHSGERAQIGSLTNPWTGAPGVPRAAAVIPYSSFTTASSSIYPYFPGVLNRHARARSWVIVNQMNESVTNSLLALYDSATQPGNPLVITPVVSNSTALGNNELWLASSESASNDNQGLLASHVDSVQVGLGMGATLPTSGNVYVYVVEEYE